jgi:hypothetical protein
MKSPALFAESGAFFVPEISQIFVGAELARESVGSGSLYIN